ncbi:MAG: hypothetical protein U9P72_07505 [Campylobacterota bacterium]|nr:hypothetical protein [Campylobacterota bacterium]
MKTIKNIIVTLVFLTSFLYASQNIIPSTLPTGIAVVPNDKKYYKHEDSDVELIYTKENLPFAKHTVSVETSLHKNYKEFFDWELDETLFVGLISSHNQVANGFSTQWPNNRQINYIGGTELVDYFSSTSWLDTLLYHETAHNYQLNLKTSPISQFLHSIFGNGSALSPSFFIVPNSMENSFMLEGNAVLNESWHGNGGRLYSGRFKAETILQAKAGNITAGDVYNTKLAFPYGNIVYIQGGFYNLYLAKKYGIKKVNSYFKHHTQDFYWPQFTNYSMLQAIGVDFEQSLESFADEYKNIPLVQAGGEHILSSQFFYSLNNDMDHIFFITNGSGRDKPELVVIDKKTFNIKKTQDSWHSGKVIKIDGEYYTQGSAKVSTTKIYQGLFDSEMYIKDKTQSKMIQGYLSDKREVYFDVPSSFSEPQLYIGDKFYAKVNSSVIIDKDDNLYYFVQDKKTRTLYKNKTPLYSYQGFYGVVSDVDSQGKIYFVANSESGSTLYRYSDSKVTRVSEADNIIEARVVNDNEVFLACISDKDYYYVKNSLKNIDEEPYETKLFFEDKEYYKKSYQVGDSKSLPNLKNSYNSILDIHYSGSDFDMGYIPNNGVIGSLNINFADPLSQNSANLFVTKDESNVTIAGLGYSNSQYLLNYTLRWYKVVEDSYREDLRDNGVIVDVSLPFLDESYYHGEFRVSYFQDYDTKEREPLTFSTLIYRAENYGASMYLNYLNALEFYAVNERDDNIFGSEYAYKYGLGSEFYLNLGLKYSFTNSNIGSNIAQVLTRGVKVTNVPDTEIDMDPSKIEMPSIRESIYLKDAGYAEIVFAKVLNYSKYFFTFPLSLQRESIYTKYRYYELNSLLSYDKSINFKINELTLGLRLSTVFLNSFEIPINMEYIYNDGEIYDSNYDNLIKNKYQFRVLLGAEF